MRTELMKFETLTDPGTISPPNFYAEVSNVMRIFIPIVIGKS
jgi:hypothetical protein